MTGNESHLFFFQYFSGTEAHPKPLLNPQAAADIANKIAASRNRAMSSVISGGRHDPSGQIVDPSLYDGPPSASSAFRTRFNTSQSNLHASSSSAAAQYSSYPDNANNSIPVDSYDRNSLINQPIDIQPEYNQQYQQQQGRQPYMNRVGGEVPSGGPYSYSNAVGPGGGGGRNPYNSHLESNRQVQSPGAGDPNKMMGNNIAGFPSSYGANANSNIMQRNSMMMMDSNQQQQQQPYTTNTMMMMDSLDHQQQQQDMGMMSRGRDPVRRSQIVPRPNNPNPSSYNYQQAQSDHFDQYRRAPSTTRDGSMDRFTSRGRSGTRGQSVGPETGPMYSRASSRQRTPLLETQGRVGSNVNIDNLIDPNLMRTRGETPSRLSGKESPIVGGAGGLSAGHGSEFGGAGGSIFSGGAIDDVVLRQKGLGQEIPPLPYTPKRTESLFLKTNAVGGSGSSAGTASPLSGTPSKVKNNICDNDTSNYGSKLTIH